MRFSNWIALNEIEGNVPDQAGLFQLKLREGLLVYPQGKSAMFYYGYAENLFRGLKRFRREILPLLEVGEDVLFVRCMAAEDTEARFQNHLNFFQSNFGSIPLGNELLLKKSNKPTTPGQ